ESQTYPPSKYFLCDVGLLDWRCYECDITEWRGRSGKDAPLQLDHIDGNVMNNCISNLRILCANCHTGTPTYAGKNRNAYLSRGVQTRRFKKDNQDSL